MSYPVVTVIEPPLSTIFVIPRNLYAGAVTDSSPAFEGGMPSWLAGWTRVPTTFADSPQLPSTKGGVPLISIASLVLRPKVADPQTRALSLVWNGPSMTSVDANWISVQNPVRAARKTEHWAVAVSVSAALGYADGSSVSNCVK